MLELPVMMMAFGWRRVQRIGRLPLRDRLFKAKRVGLGRLLRRKGKRKRAKKNQTPDGAVSSLSHVVLTC